MFSSCILPECNFFKTEGIKQAGQSWIFWDLPQSYDRLKERFLEKRWKALLYKRFRMHGKARSLLEFLIDASKPLYVHKPCSFDCAVQSQQLLWVASWPPSWKYSPFPVLLLRYSTVQINTIISVLFISPNTWEWAWMPNKIHTWQKDSCRWETTIFSFGKPQSLFYSFEYILILLGLNFERQCARGK